MNSTSDGEGELWKKLRENGSNNRSERKRFHDLLNKKWQKYVVKAKLTYIVIKDIDKKEKLIHTFFFENWW